MTTHGGPRIEVKLSSGSRQFGTACIWAGVAGALSERRIIFDQENISYAVYDESAGAYPGVTWEAAAASEENVITTFVFCSEFPGTDFIWDFFLKVPPYRVNQSFHAFLKVRPKDQWCYMQGVAAADASTFTAALGINDNPSPPWDAGGPAYYADVYSGGYTGNPGLLWNCMPINQKGF